MRQLILRLYYMSTHCTTCHLRSGATCDLQLAIPATVIPHESAANIRDAMRFPAPSGPTTGDATVFVRFITQQVKVTDRRMPHQCQLSHVIVCNQRLSCTCMATSAHVTLKVATASGFCSSRPKTLFRSVLLCSSAELSADLVIGPLLRRGEK